MYLHVYTHKNKCMTTNFMTLEKILNLLQEGIPGWLSGLVSAFGPGYDPGVLGSWDQALCQAPYMESASPSACVSAPSLSLSVSLMNK